MALSPPEPHAAFNIPTVRTEKREGSVDLTADAAVEVAGDRLRATGYPGLRHVACSFYEGRLILRGRVTSFFYKQLAQEVLRALPGKQSILNQVEVVENGTKTLTG